MAFASYGLARDAAGEFDPTFSGNGKLTTHLRDFAVVNSVAIDARGRIVVGGLSRPDDGPLDFALARYKSRGSLDPTFSGDGKVTTSFGGFSGAIAHSIAIDAQGRIVAGGFTGQPSEFTLARYNPDGSLDASFDADGKLTAAIGDSDAAINSVAIDAEGRIVAGGSSGTFRRADFALARFNPDGSLDASFDGDGKLTTAFGDTDDYATSVAIDADGRIVAGGVSGRPNRSDFALARYNPDGSLDAGFDGDGMLTTRFGSRRDIAHSVAIDSRARIVAGGVKTRRRGRSNFALARYLPDGSLDASFSRDGKLTTRIRRSNTVSSVAIDPRGRILAGGSSRRSFNTRFTLARYRSKGRLDRSFSGDGTVTTRIDERFNDANSMAIDPRGRIVLGGVTNFDDTAADFALARYIGDG